MEAAALTLGPGILGRRAGPETHEVDARWLMAYAAALGETAGEYLDTGRPGGILASPLFPVCYEWPLALALRVGAIPDPVALRGVHATHDLLLHRRPRPGDRLRTTAAVTTVEARRPGAYVVVRFETVDGAGAAVSTTDYGTLYLGVGCETPATPRATGGGAGPGSAPAVWETRVTVPATLGHVYSECARIWNPIHTDRAIAQAAGLPEPILHGTATLALAVAEVLRRDGAGPAAPVSRICGRLDGMVPMPSTLVVRGVGRIDAPEGRWLGFEAVAADGRRAVRDGRILIAARA